MKSKATMSDIAKMAGVSQASVSQILNENSNMSFSEETVARVREAARQLNYQSPNVVARQKLSKTIMVISVNICNPYYAMIIQSIEKEAYFYKYNIIIRNTYRNPMLEKACIDTALDMNVDGVILLSVMEDSESMRRLAQRIPIVCICDRVENTSFDTIEMTHKTSAKLVIDHLVSLGHKDIAMITTAPEENFGRQERLAGLQNQMEKYGLAEHFHIFAAEPSRFREIEDFANDYNTGYRLLQNDAIYKSPITAFVGTNDPVAFGVMDALIDRGYRVPEDYSVCGFDNCMYSQLHGVSLTTVDHRMDIKGKSAIELLMKKITLLSNGEDEEKLSDLFKIEYQPHLMVRRSSGPVPKRPASKG